MAQRMESKGAQQTLRHPIRSDEGSQCKQRDALLAPPTCQKTSPCAFCPTPGSRRSSLPLARSTCSDGGRGTERGDGERQVPRALVGGMRGPRLLPSPAACPFPFNPLAQRTLRLHLCMLPPPPPPPFCTDLHKLRAAQVVQHGPQAAVRGGGQRVDVLLQREQGELTQLRRRGGSQRRAGGRG